MKDTLRFDVPQFNPLDLPDNNLVNGCYEAEALRLRAAIRRARADQVHPDRIALAEADLRRYVPTY